MFKRIHQVFISPDSPTKFPYNRSIDVEVHCAVIEYEKGKVKPAHYLVLLTDLEDLMTKGKIVFQKDKEWSLIML